MQNKVFYNTTEAQVQIFGQQKTLRWQGIVSDNGPGGFFKYLKCWLSDGIFNFIKSEQSDFCIDS